MRHVVSYSGGLASFFESKLSIEKYGKENCDFVFCDTKTEDEDLYRFLEDTEKYLGIKIVRLQEGRDIWQVAFDQNFLFNSMVANCTKELKQKQFKNYIKKYNEDITIHLGFDFTEMHRLERARTHYKCNVESLVCESMINKIEMKSELEKIGIELPRLYQLGFSHNNCGGFCFKAGIGHFKNLYEKLPDRYIYHMNKEQELINKIGKDISILKRIDNGKKIKVTLKDLKEIFDNEPQQLSFDDLCDYGGCNCFTE